MRQIVLDTETTGLSPAQGHRVIEIGGIELIDRRMTGRDFHCFLHPDREIDEAAERVHGISLADLETAPRFAEVAEEFLAFVAGELVAETEVAFEDNGAYSLFLPEGDVTVIAVAEGTAGPPPAPYTQTVTDTGSVAQLTHDFDLSLLALWNGDLKLIKVLVRLRETPGFVLLTLRLAVRKRADELLFEVYIVSGVERM